MFHPATQNTPNHKQKMLLKIYFPLKIFFSLLQLVKCNVMTIIKIKWSPVLFLLLPRDASSNLYCADAKKTHLRE